MNYRLSLLSLAMILSAAMPSAAAAVSKPLNLITSPLPINLSAAPGSSVTTELRVKQNSGTDERLKVSLMKFSAYGNEGKPQLLERAPGDDYFDWVKFDKPTFAAPDNVWQTVKMTIDLPKTAAFGYYYAVVFSREGDDKAAGRNTNALNGGTAVLVLLEAQTPGAKRELAIDSFASVHNVYEFLPAKFKVTLKNSGSLHAVPHGTIFILQDKKQVAAVDLNDEQGNILPNTKRVYPVEWTDSFPHFEKVVEDGKVKQVKNGEPAMQLVWSNGGVGAKDSMPHLRFGKFTAHLVAVYDDGQRDVPIEADVSFWVIPWRILLGLLLGAGLIGLGVYAAVRGFWRRARQIGNRS